MDDPEPRRDSPGIGFALTILCGLVSAVWFYVQLRIWQEEGHDHTLTVANILVTILLWSALCYAIYRDLKDASRAKSLHAQIVTIKDDFRAESEGSNRLHDVEVRRLGASHAAELSRSVAIRDQIKAEKREALDKASDLEARLALISLASTSREVEQSGPLTPRELREQVLGIAGDLCALLIGHSKELNSPYKDDGFAGLGPSPPDDPEIRAEFVSAFGTRISDAKAHLGDRGLLGEQFNFSSVGDALDSSSVRNADDVRKIIKCLDLAAKIVDEKFIRGISFPFASGIRSGDEGFELSWKLKEFHESLPPCPGFPNSQSDLTAENADGYASQLCTSIRAWSNQIRHAYAERFSVPVNELIHKWGSKGLDVRALEEYSKSVENDENVSNVVEALQKLASGLEGR